MLGHSELSVDVPVPVVFVLQFYCCLDSWNAGSLLSGNFSSLSEKFPVPLVLSFSPTVAWIHGMLGHFFPVIFLHSQI